MFDIFFKIWFFIAILPFLMAIEGYGKLKVFLEKKNIKIDILYVILAVLIFLLIFFLVVGYS